MGEITPITRKNSIWPPSYPGGGGGGKGPSRNYLREIKRLETRGEKSPHKYREGENAAIIYESPGQ